MLPGARLVNFGYPSLFAGTLEMGMYRTTIGIAGGSASGKTTLADALAARLEAVIIRTDDYYRPLDHLPFEERCRVNFDDPEAIDHELLQQHIELLRAGRAIDAPRYDFTKHTRSPRRHKVLPRKTVMIEGIFSLCYSPIREICDVSIFVDTGEEECLRRRLDRDVRERGRDEREVMARFRNQVTPMFYRYVQPIRDLADVVVSGEVDTDLNVAAVLNFIDDRISVPA